MLTGAQAMVKCLEAEGVEVLFGYPGAAICPFYDALFESPLRHVLVRTEQDAAHMASGYARASGRPKGLVKVRVQVAVPPRVTRWVEASKIARQPSIAGRLTASPRRGRHSTAKKMK